MKPENVLGLFDTLNLVKTHSYLEFLNTYRQFRGLESLPGPLPELPHLIAEFGSQIAVTLINAAIAINLQFGQGLNAFANLPPAEITKTLASLPNDTQFAALIVSTSLIQLGVRWAVNRVSPRDAGEKMEIICREQRQSKLAYDHAIRMRLRDSAPNQFLLSPLSPLA